MIDYRAGQFGFHVAWGLRGSLAPRALAMAIPNAVLTYIIATWFIDSSEYSEDEKDIAKAVIGAGTAVMGFILYNRSRTSYSRWWEGGTLLQKARGEWFNAYSSIMAFTSVKPELQEEVDAYTHLTARLMSLLMCCALQQVSPNRDRPFEIISLEGIEPASIQFLNSAPDKVEIILQWIQRSMVLQMQTGVLPVAPPILSRAFQEVSRGIVNLQNARKIADFPYPFPLAQISMILQLLHWATAPFAAAYAMPREWAVLFVFFSIFTLWCIHFNALDLEFPFGPRVNDLPMTDFQQDWNKSICTLLYRRAQRPPTFEFDPSIHGELGVAMSDSSGLIRSNCKPSSNRTTVSRITIGKVCTDATVVNNGSVSHRLNDDTTPFHIPAEEQEKDDMKEEKMSLTIARTVLQPFQESARRISGIGDGVIRRQFGSASSRFGGSERHSSIGLERRQSSDDEIRKESSGDAGKTTASEDSMIRDISPNSVDIDMPVVLSMSDSLDGSGDPSSNESHHCASSGPRSHSKESAQSYSNGTHPSGGGELPKPVGLEPLILGATAKQSCKSAKSKNMTTI